MCSILLCLLLPGMQVEPAGVGPDKFWRIAKGALADVEDVSFAYEGTTQRVDAGLAPEERAKSRRKFHGSYAWRDDGSILADDYLGMGETPDPIAWNTVSMFGGEMVKVSRSPDARIPPVTQRRQRGSPWALYDCPAHKINWLWYYQWLPDPKSLNYVDLGWDVIDGHQCLKVQVDFSPGPADPKKAKIRLWIDLDRGANPIRVERLIHPPDVGSGIHSIELQSFELPGAKRVWLPISAIEETFLIGGQRYAPDPVWREKCAVVRNSVVFNRGLPDRLFEISTKERTRRSTSKLENSKK